MKLRTYGRPPYTVAVVHGGPGAPGEMAPVAWALSTYAGILEPLQTAATLDGQVQELAEVLIEHAEPPVTLIGHSWGAILGFITAARYPGLVGKLILVGSAPFEERYAGAIMATRLLRLSDGERSEALALAEKFSDPAIEQNGKAFARFGELMAAADACDPLPHDDEVLEYQPAINRSVWEEARSLRSSGELLALGKNIRCPVIAIHGDHDPHPAAGVREPLSRVLADFRFILLDACGHAPWHERRARDAFFAILEREIRRSL
ncbi:alpha/beta hydrolase [Methanoculleus taiwanensis]|uniref:Alpha/beta hydrolase n=1 Tax=Methanoculleus taiwanensis TaxID=1550565 RepID=A0A498H001_9EURY|nr:alpha/beta hydrolase [Methanoculleus taiwanensis]RXE55665.1 alpha/beta hydrolase [Methanoculleus taiwanensis]